MTMTNLISETTQPRRVQWMRAFKILLQLKKSYDSNLIADFTAAMDGGDTERRFQAFLAEEGAQALLAERPCLARTLDDEALLGSMPNDSLGRAFLDAARRDGIRVGELAAEVRDAGCAGTGPVNSDQQWYRERGVASHDLLHVLTAYGRDPAGETALIAFTLPLHPVRILKVSLVFALLGAPKRRYFSLLRYLARAYQRGRRARIPDALRWEELLPLPIDEVRARLRVQPTAEAHPGGVWRALGEHGPWVTV